MKSLVIPAFYSYNQFKCNAETSFQDQFSSTRLAFSGLKQGDRLSSPHIEREQEYILKSFIKHPKCKRVPYLLPSGSVQRILNEDQVKETKSLESIDPTLFANSI